MLAAGRALAVTDPGDPPSPSAVALAQRKCGACHAVPAPGSRRNGWPAASINMHTRRVALAPQDWALVREYLRVPAK